MGYLFLCRGRTAAVLYGEVGMEKSNAIKDYETAAI